MQFTGSAIRMAGRGVANFARRPGMYGNLAMLGGGAALFGMSASNARNRGLGVGNGVGMAAGAGLAGLGGWRSMLAAGGRRGLGQGMGRISQQMMRDTATSTLGLISQGKGISKWANKDISAARMMGLGMHRAGNWIGGM